MKYPYLLAFLFLGLIPLSSYAAMHVDATNYGTSNWVAPVGSLTIMGWINPDNGNQNNAIFAVGSTTGNTVALRYMSNWNANANGLIQRWYASTAADQITTASTSNLSQWSFFRVGDDETNHLLTFQLWNASGTLYASSSLAENATARLSSTGLVIGHSNPADNSANVGCMANLMIYNSVVSPASATQVMFQQTPATSSMSAFFPLANGTDTSELVGNKTISFQGAPTTCTSTPPFTIVPRSAIVSTWTQIITD